MLKGLRAFAADPRTQFLAMTVFLVVATWGIGEFLEPFREQPVPTFRFVPDETLPEFYVDLASGAKAPHPFRLSGTVAEARFERIRLTFNGTAFSAPSITLFNVTGRVLAGDDEYPFQADRVGVAPQPGDASVQALGTFRLVTGNPVTVAGGAVAVDAEDARRWTRLEHEGLLVPNAAITFYSDEGHAFEPALGMLVVDAGTASITGRLAVTPTADAFSLEKTPPAAGQGDPFESRGRLTLRSQDQVAELGSRVFPLGNQTALEFAEVSGFVTPATGQVSLDGSLYQWFEGGRVRLPPRVAVEVMEGLDAGVGSDGNMSVAPAKGAPSAEVIVRIRESGGVGSAVEPRLRATNASASLTLVGWYGSWESARSGGPSEGVPDALAPGEEVFLRLRVRAPEGPLPLAVSAWGSPDVPVRAVYRP